MNLQRVVDNTFEKTRNSGIAPHTEGVEAEAVQQEELHYLYSSLMIDTRGLCALGTP